MIEIINTIPAGERLLIEDALNNLMESEGYGKVSFVVVKGKLATWEMTESRKINN